MALSLRYLRYAASACAPGCGQATPVAPGFYSQHFLDRGPHRFHVRRAGMRGCAARGPRVRMWKTQVVAQSEVHRRTLRLVDTLPRFAGLQSGRCEENSDIRDYRAKRPRDRALLIESIVFSCPLLIMVRRQQTHNPPIISVKQEMRLVPYAASTAHRKLSELGCRGTALPCPRGTGTVSCWPGHVSAVPLHHFLHLYSEHLPLSAYFPATGGRSIIRTVRFNRGI